MSKALIVLAHGSRNSAAVKEMEGLSRSLKKSQKLDYDHIATAFLELAEPSMNTVVEHLVAQEVKYFVVMPYFLSSGNHVSRDIPLLIAELMERHAHCEFDLISYFGSNDNTVEWVANHVKDHVV